MAQNLCTPQNTFGSFPQTLFCGASVLSFSASLGWNSQQSECTVTLVEDDCDGHERVYWDKFLNRQTRTNADPGFTRPSIGAPAMFRIGDFEYAGLIQSWREVNSVNGKPTFEVKLVDPREVLEGTQIITSDYAGSVDQLYNVINVFGYMESFGVLCPQVVINGAVFGTPAGGYGGALVNTNGMQWNRLKDGISLLTSAFPLQINQWSPYGRMVFKGAEATKDGYGVMGADDFDPSIIVNFPNHHGYISYFLVDLSEIPDAPSFWRVPGPSLNLLDLITQVCTTAGCDFYIELIPVRFGAGITKIIKIRTVSRNSQPLLGQIESFINSASNKVIDDAVGRELRNEDSSTFLIGDNIQSVYQAFNGVQSGIVEPYWGLDAAGDVIVASVVDGEYVIPVSFIELNNQLFSPLPTTTGEFTENELLHAIAGFDQFLAYTLGVPTDLGDKIASRGLARHLYNFDNVSRLIDFLLNFDRNLSPRQLMAMSEFFELNDTDMKDLEVIFQFVANYAREVWGRKFQVHLPFTCAYFDTESQGYFTSEEPSLDGGWTETTDVIGLPHPTLTVPFETDFLGKLGPFLRFPGGTGLEYPDTNTEDFVFYDGNLYVKGDIEDEFVYLDRSSFTGPRVVVTLQDAIFEKQANPDDINRQASAFVKLLEEKKGADAAAKLKEAIKNIGNQNILYETEPLPSLPDAAAVPLRSNISTYGPWYIRGPAGRASMTQDIGLVPWEFGSTANLQAAGIARVSNSVTFQQVVENGSITIAGYPDVPLGAELGAVAGGFFGGGQNLVESRNLVIRTFDDTFAGGSDASIQYRQFTYGQWTGLYGPNITNIAVSAGQQGVTTTYTMRTFTPQFGRFTKSNVERFGQIGRQRLERLKGRKVNRNLQARINALVRRIQERDRINLVTKRDGRNRTSPTDLFVGQQFRWPKTLTNNDELFRNNIVEAIPFHEALAEFENYNKKAMMSMDGLIRPISKSGDGGLPQYITPTGDQCEKLPHLSEQPQPPIQDYDPVIVNTSYLDPIVNPGQVKHGTSDGHDIDILARGSTVPASSLSIPVDKEGGGGYEGDYRFFGLRGPLLLHSWGYDIDGKPVPNAADTESDASGGVFTEVDLENEFFTDWLRKSHTWPVAPVDLRLDRKRGVWTVPQTPRIIRATVDGVIPQGNSGDATPTNLGTLYDETGGVITSPKITVTAADASLTAGQKINAYYDSEDCTYYPITASGGAGSGIIISSLGCDCPMTYENNVFQKQASHIIFGTGLIVVSGSCNPALGSPTTYTVLGGIETDSSLASVSVPSIPPRVSKITFGENLTTEDLGNCEMLVTADAGGLNISDFTCTCDSGIVNQNVSHLAFGTGLDVIAGACAGDADYTVVGGIKGAFGSECFPSGFPVDDVRASLLEFHGGMNTAYDPDRCAIKIGAYFLATGTTCPIGDHPPSGFNELRFAEGIKTNQLDQCTLELNTNLRITDDTRVATQVYDIDLGCGLSGAGGECITSIAVNPLSDSGTVQEVRLVEDIFCTGNVLTIQYATLIFSECGLFIGSG